MIYYKLANLIRILTCWPLVIYRRSSSTCRASHQHLRQISQQVSAPLHRQDWLGLDLKWLDIEELAIYQQADASTFAAAGLQWLGLHRLKVANLTSVASTSCSFEMRNTFLAEDKRQMLKMKYAQSQSVIKALWLVKVWLAVWQKDCQHCHDYTPVAQGHISTRGGYHPRGGNPPPSP